jgi:pimeloyl-ACP methyl ester carboxylesterase
LTTFVLVHGAWHGAWAWEKVAAELKNAGHRVLAFDLPAAGDDQTPGHEVTLDSYAAAIAKVIRAEKEKVVLVGHSMGGIAISAAAELVPDRIRRLIYLTGFLPRHGETLLALEERNPRPTVPPALVVKEGSPTAVLHPDRIVEIFFHDLPPHEAEAAKAKLTPQPLAPLATPIKLTPERFGRVPKSYIECTDDHAISIELQRDMISKTPVDEVVSLKSSHSPFLSMPLETARALMRLT